MNDACSSGTCSGDPLDSDGDTHVSDACGGDDCNDDPLNGPSVYPGATEICDDEIDNNCDGDTDCVDSECSSEPDLCYGICCADDFVESLFLMPLGDSITKGYYGDVGGIPHFGYRDHLQDNLNYGYNFVGKYSDPASTAYDSNHEGADGQLTDAILTRLNTRISEDSMFMGNVDGLNSCVLIHAGTNDIRYRVGTDQSRVDNIEDMIDAIDAFNPDIQIYVALIIPIYHRYPNWLLKKRVISFNKLLAAMISGYGKSNLYTVDMYSRFANYPGDLSNLYGDYWGVHPNDTGYDLMGQVWADAINGNFVVQD
jgi:lysophospholipase L1-like esterase